MGHQKNAVTAYCVHIIRLYSIDVLYKRVFLPESNFYARPHTFVCGGGCRIGRGGEGGGGESCVLVSMRVSVCVCARARVSTRSVYLCMCLCVPV